MVVQIIGNRVVGGATYAPPPEPTNNPNVFSKLREPTARNWDSLGRPTNLPQMTPSTPLSVSDRLAGRSTPQLTPPGSGTTVVPANSSYVPLSSRLGGGTTPAIVPSGVPTATAQAESLIIPRGAGIRIPSGTGSAAIGVLLSLPSELPRLMGLLSNPQQYWREQEEQRRRELPHLYPGENAARSGLNRSLRLALPVIPFQGGQSQNIGYQITMREQRRDRPDAVFTSLVSGAIGGIVTERSIVGGNQILAWFLVSGSGAVRTFLGSSSVDGGQSFSIDSINRADGQPDIGGDPAPVANPNAPRRPALAPNTAPYSPAAPSRVPNAVPMNAPNLINPQTGARIAPNTGTDTASRPSTAPATTPNPFSPGLTLAPRITPEQLKRITPTPISPEANPALAAQPRTGFSNRAGDWGVQLGQEGLYGESAAEYWHRNSSPTSSNPNPGSSAQPSTTPGLLPVGALGIGLLLGGLTAANFGPSRTTRITTPAAAPDTSAPTAPVTGGGNQPGFCRFRDDPHSPAINQRTGRMEQVDLAIQAYQTTMLTQLDNKMGAQLPNGGVAGKLGRMAGLASKTWNFLQIDRALAVFTWIGVLHNAYMLSNNLGQTLFSAISNGLDAIGIQKVDAEGNEEPYDVGEIVQKYTDNYGKSIFGVETWTGIKANWKAFNRIYQAASNILNSLQSITFSMVEMIEQVANNTGKIGNALQKSGTILQKSFNWMNPSNNFSNNRFFNALNNTQEAVEAVDQIASEVLSIQQTAKELADQKSEFEKAAADAEKLLNKKATDATANSTRPSIPVTPADEKKAVQP